MGTTKDRNGMYLTEAEDIKKRWQEYTEELYKKDLHDQDNHNGVITHLEPDILECKVKWASGSITTNKASGGDGIPVELFHILKDDAVKVLHSICQQIWKSQQWPQDWKRSVFIPIPKKDNAKECSNYLSIALILHASKLMLKFSKPGFNSLWTSWTELNLLGWLSHKESASNAGTMGDLRSLRLKDLLEEEMATHSSILTWRIQQTEGPIRLWSSRSQSPTRLKRFSMQAHFTKTTPSAPTHVSSIGKVQFSHSVVSNSLRPHGLQQARLPCPSPTPGPCSNSCPSSQWCHPTISSSVVPFSSSLQSFPASGSFPMSQFFASG